MPPRSSTQIGTPTLIFTVPVRTISTTAARGPTAFATSFAPWAKATLHDEMSARGTKTPSTRRSCSGSGRPSPPRILRRTNSR